MDQFQFGTTFDQPDITLLQWFSLNEGFPVLEVSFQGGFPIQSWYLDQLHVGVKDKETDITCYPNPTTDYLNIKISGSPNFNLNIYDLNGKLLKSEKNNTSIQIQDLTNGLYIVEIVDLENDNKIIRKIIKE